MVGASLSGRVPALRRLGAAQPVALRPRLPWPGGKPNPLAACLFLPQKSSLERLRAAPGREARGSGTPTERQPPPPAPCAARRMRGTGGPRASRGSTGRQVHAHLLPGPPPPRDSPSPFPFSKGLGTVGLEAGLLNVIGSTGTPLVCEKGFGWKEDDHRGDWEEVVNH